MKRILMMFVVAAVISPVSSAFADCPDRYYEIYGPGSATDEWIFATTCASTSGNVGSDTMSCYSWPANRFNYGSGSAVYTMTVPTGTGGSHWSVAAYVDFDANGYSSSGVSATVTVRHNGSTTVYDSFLAHGGNDGTLSCDYISTNYFSVSDGDEIDVEYDATNYGTSVIRLTPPYIFDN